MSLDFGSQVMRKVLLEFEDWFKGTQIAILSDSQAYHSGEVAFPRMCKHAANGVLSHPRPVKAVISKFSKPGLWKRTGSHLTWASSVLIACGLLAGILLCENGTSHSGHSWTFFWYKSSSPSVDLMVTQQSSEAIHPPLQIVVVATCGAGNTDVGNICVFPWHPVGLLSLFISWSTGKVRFLGPQC